MALTLAESAKLSTDTLARGVLETFVQTSPILDRIPFMEIEGKPYAYNEEATPAPASAFRNRQRGVHRIHRHRQPAKARSS